MTPYDNQQRPTSSAGGGWVDNSADFYLRCATPGEPNAPAGLSCEDPVTVDDESWGTIKALFR